MRNRELAEIAVVVSLNFRVNKSVINATTQEPLTAINLLSNLTTGDGEEPVDAGTAVYLLGSILNRFNSTDSDMLEEFSQVINSMVYRTDVSAIFIYTELY